VDRTDGAVRRVVDNVACTVCGCVCDDLRVTVANGRIERTEGACHLAEPWFAALAAVDQEGGDRLPPAQIDGQPAALDAAVARAADLLRAARAPLIYGLSRSSTEGQRAAVRLADAIGATVDTTASLGHGPSVMAVQEVGECTCTLGEARNRADLVIFWGTNPAESHPRHMERYSVGPIGEFVPGGRAGRTVVVVDVEQTATATQADLFVRVEPGQDFEAIWTLRGLLRGIEPVAGTATGAPPPVLTDLLDRMLRCRWGVVFFGFGLSRAPLGHRSVEALLRLVTELNQHTRFYVRRMRGSGDVAGADSVLAWQTGYPFAVNLARGYPRYNPGEYAAEAVLSRGEADACLLVGSYGVRRFSRAAQEHLARIPTIVLDPPIAQPTVTPTVHFATAIYGAHLPGTAYRMDEVPIPLRAFLPAKHPSDAEVLDAIRGKLG
jgi:formylmethanofuran dehydrogenase subunit B